jgi:hypothetical protein
MKAYREFFLKWWKHGRALKRKHETNLHMQGGYGWNYMKDVTQKNQSNIDAIESKLIWNKTKTN